MAGKTVSIGEAAKQLGVSTDTLRRWDKAGTLRTSRDARNRRRVPVSEVERLRDAPARHPTGDTFSAHRSLQVFLETHPEEFDIADTDLASRQFLELSMASIYKRRLFGNLEKPAEPAHIEYVVGKAVDMFLSYYGRK
mgnify:CR=1 FL=1